MDVLIDLFSTQGRANRSWYLWHILLDDLAMFTAGVGLIVLSVVTGVPFFILPAIGVFVGGFWAGVCITIKRLHDLERPSWHWWLLLVPIYNMYLGLVLLFQKGTDGPNEFGTDPLASAKAISG
jgi:uncharacterized membrane protein YhaH (DUF805 family)